MPKVSVVIPTYNRSQYLARAIRSVLGQSFQDFEIVVVDDASTDNTPQIVRSFQDPRIRYFRHDTNRKEAGSRNTGVQNSLGEYVAFLDDDDEWLPQKLALQVDLLDKGSAKLGAVYSSFLKVDAESRKVLGPWVAKKRGSIYKDLSVQNWIGIPSTVVLRCQCFDTVGLFDEKIEFGLDYDMWIRIAQVYEYEYLEEPLVLRSINHTRLSTNHALVLKGAENQLNKYTEFFSANRRSYSRRLLGLGVLYCYNGDVQKGRAAFVQAIQCNPLEMRNYYNLALSLLGVERFRKIKQFRDRISLPWHIIKKVSFSVLLMVT
jgi:glycosyltransferase involved in cell wall biosynthesis